MPIKISKDTVIYDDKIFQPGFGYPRGSINGCIRYNSMLQDIELGINEKWVPLLSIVQHPLENLIRYNHTLGDFEFLVNGVWVLRCDCPDLPREQTKPPPPRDPYPPRVRPPPTEYDLLVNLDPGTVRLHAKWVVSGKTGASTHQDKVSLQTGHYYVFFTDVQGWITPDPIGILIHAGMPDNTREITGIYKRRKFSVRVLFYPEEIQDEAIASIIGRDGVAGHEEHLDDIILYTFSESYEVIPHDVDNWVTPDPQTVTFELSMITDTIDVIFEYIEKEYELQVFFTPDDVHEDAWWSVSGVMGHYKSGDIIQGLLYDEYEIFSSIVSGYITPELVTVDVEDGIPDDRKIVIIDYIPEYFNLRVIIRPPEIFDDARWSVHGFDGEYASGETAAYPRGEQTVYFNEVYGWITPEDETVELVTGMFNDTRELMVEYEPVPYGLVVTIDPPEVREEARWHASTLPGLHKHDVPSTDVYLKDYTVKFTSISGWKRPDDIETTIEPGMPGNTRRLHATYIAEEQELSVRILPPEVREEARWFLSGSTEELLNEQVKYVLPGTYEISFKPIFGWTHPSNRDVTVGISSKQITAHYIEEPAADLRCGSILLQGNEEAEQYTLYIGEDITHIEIHFFTSWRPDRMLIYEGLHPGLTGDMVENNMDPYDTHLLYDTGWRYKPDPTGSVIIDSSKYPGLRIDAPDEKYCIDTRTWTGAIKTVMAYGRDFEGQTNWAVYNLRCFTGTPYCPGNNPPTYDRGL